MKRILVAVALVVVLTGCCLGNPRLGTLSGKFVAADAEQEAIGIAGTAFQTRTQVTDAVAVAIAESSLFTGIRRWYNQERTDGGECCLNVDTVHKPDPTWPCTQHENCVADRGLWQINSSVWNVKNPYCQVTDEQADTPKLAAAVAYCIFHHDNDNWNAWQAWANNIAQRYIGPYSGDVSGWPAVAAQVSIYCNKNHEGWCSK